MINTIFSANRKKLAQPMFVAVIVRNWGQKRGKREYLVYETREDRDIANNWRTNGLYNRRLFELYFINVYPKHEYGKGKGARA
jgi:hypothetical protein